jgi:hypothetical protein
MEDTSNKVEVKPLEQVTPEDVVNFLKNGDKTESIASKKKGDVILSAKDLDEEDKRVLFKMENASKKEDLAPKVDLPADTTFHEDTPTVGEAFVKNSFFPSLGDVSLTSFEKDLYMKALLNDTALEWTINPYPQIDVTIKSKTINDEEVIFLCLERERMEGYLQGPESYYSRMQMFSAAVQLVKFGKDYTQIELPLLRNKETLDEAYKILTEKVKESILPMTAVKWAALVTALRIFETKLKMCNDNLRNENFWRPAGTN